MANQRLFIEKIAHQEKVGNSMSTTYCYNSKGQLTIFWKGEKVAERTGVKIGDAFVISCNGAGPTIDNLKVPYRNNDLLMWLLSFGKEARAYSAEEYTLLLNNRRDEYGWWNYGERGIAGDGYAFTLCNRPDCGGVHHLAAYVDRPVDKQLVKEVLFSWSRGVYYPHAFVEKILRDRFGFTDYDLKELADHLVA